MGVEEYTADKIIKAFVLFVKFFFVITAVFFVIFYKENSPNTGYNFPHELKGLRASSPVWKSRTELFLEKSVRFVP